MLNKFSRVDVPRIAWLSYQAGRESQLRDEWMSKARASTAFRKDNVFAARLFNKMYVYWLREIRKERAK